MGKKMISGADMSKHGRRGEAKKVTKRPEKTWWKENRQKRTKQQAEQTMASWSKGRVNNSSKADPVN